MMRFQNLYYDSFLERYSSKRIIVYGAGGTFLDFLRVQSEKRELVEAIDFLIDADPEKKGQPVQAGYKTLFVQGLEEYVDRDPMADMYVMILFLADRYIPEALEQLDQIKAFDGMICLHGQTALLWGKEGLPPLPPAGKHVLKEPKKYYEIPKMIHYCWFGKKKIPSKNLEYIESWKRACPDYTIRLWNESNYPIERTPLYVQEAYQAGKYSFVSDYARLDILYKHGGIYLDTDVELFASLDQFLSYKAFFAFESFNLVNTGLGCGCVEKSEIMAELMALYTERRFLMEDGTLNMTPCPDIHTKFFEKKGLQICNETQLLDDVLFLSSDFLCAFDQGRGICAFTENTVGTHHFDCSWFNQKEKSEWENFKEKKKAINRRLLQDFILTKRW